MKSLFNESRSRFINRPLKNPTQLDARRFKRDIGSPLVSGFTKSKQEFGDLLKTTMNKLRTHYEDLEL
jgi:hypothetical protein